MHVIKGILHLCHSAHELSTKVDLQQLWSEKGPSFVNLLEDTSYLGRILWFLRLCLCNGWQYRIQSNTVPKHTCTPCDCETFMQKNHGAETERRPGGLRLAQTYRTLLRGWQVYLLKGLVLYHARATCLHTFFNPEGQACGESIACGQYL